MNDELEKTIKGKVILITGGTGSFGSWVVDRLLTLGPKKLIIFSRDEKKQDDMRILYNHPKLKFVIGDVRDKEVVDRIVEGVDYIFHAAALKQVPTCEFFPLEAVKTNILGTANILSAAALHNVERVVVLSTDKAVYPINAMGMTKALMEKTMIAAAKNYPPQEGKKTFFCGVRYGNVLYSRGSVIPYFVELIKQKKKLTLTNAKMTRFLLPLREAVDLVLYALINGEHGNIYVKKSPACTVEILAKAMCRLFNYKLGYEEVGVRAGEKMAETLISKEEMMRTEETKTYFKIRPESQGLDYEKYLTTSDDKRRKKINQESYTSDNTDQLSVSEVKKLLLTLPEIQKELTNLKSK